MYYLCLIKDVLYKIWHYCGDIKQGWFFSYLTDFSYFSVKKKFRNLQNTVRTGQKMTFLKEGVDGFCYFPSFTVILFSIQNHTWLNNGVIFENITRHFILFIFPLLHTHAKTLIWWNVHSNIKTFLQITRIRQPHSNLMNFFFFT